MEPTPDDLDRMEHALGWRPASFRLGAPHRASNLPPARWLVEAEGRSAFIKVGATEATAEFFRREHANYEAIRASFMPRLLGYFDDGIRPVLAIEDLSDARWPPPWTSREVDAVLHRLDELHRLPPPGHLARIEAPEGADWKRVAEDPSRWAALGLCTTEWLAAALPTLIAAAAAAPLPGDALVHLDVRSDNVCFRAGSAILVDWPEATIANPDLDIAFWLPSLESEGGPPPESILPGRAELAAWVAGFFFSRAALPDIAEAPYVRPLQLSQSRTALPWAARALGLPAPR